MRYFVIDSRCPPEGRVLTSQSGPGVVEPTVLHRVEPLGKVRFQVQFRRLKT